MEKKTLSTIAIVGSLLVIVFLATLLINLNNEKKQLENVIVEKPSSIEYEKPSPPRQVTVVEPPAVEEPVVNQEAEPENLGLSNEVVIKIHDGIFDPAEITIPVDTEVTWINDDFVDGRPMRAHRVAEKRRVFYGERIEPGQSYSFTFTEAGEYEYFDVMFRAMQGVVIVQSDLSTITGNVVFGNNNVNPRLGGVSFMLLLSVILGIIFSREKRRI